LASVFREETITMQNRCALFDKQRRHGKSIELVALLQSDHELEWERAPMDAAEIQPHRRRITAAHASFTAGALASTGMPPIALPLSSALMKSVRRF
jgi:hypothetical protein